MVILETIQPMTDKIANRIAQGKRNHAHVTKALIEKAIAKVQKYADENNGDLIPCLSRYACIYKPSDAIEKMNYGLAPVVLIEKTGRFGTHSERKSISRMTESMREGSRIGNMTDSEIEKEAMKQATDIVTSFANKFEEKVSSVGSIESGRIQGEDIHGFTLWLDFASGRTLELRTNIKWVVNSHGTEFCQWPTLIYENGKRLTVAMLAA